MNKVSLAREIVCKQVLTHVAFVYNKVMSFLEDIEIYVWEKSCINIFFHKAFLKVPIETLHMCNSFLGTWVRQNIAFLSNIMSAGEKPFSYPNTRNLMSLLKVFFVRI